MWFPPRFELPRSGLACGQGPNFSTMVPRYELITVSVGRMLLS